MSSDLPELEFELDEAFFRMDEAVAETIAGLPDFPGFETRTSLKLECSDPERESYEFAYTFPDETVGEKRFTEDYFAILKEHWTVIGWDVHSEREDVNGKIDDIEAIRPDGVNVWYSNMMGRIVIHSQVACVRSSESGGIFCGPPLGGVTPENDRTRDCIVKEPEPDGGESIDAAAPFEGMPAALDPFSPNGSGVEAFESPGSYDGQL